MAKNGTKGNALVKLIYNKGAGNNEVDKKYLCGLIRQQGFSCEYSSTKNNSWKELKPHTRHIAIAGGDGTVRKVTRELLLQNKLSENFPLAVIPYGTANNISLTLGLSGSPEELIGNWKNNATKKLDIGIVHGLSPDDFFIESFGYGIFPYLMLEIEKSTAMKGGTAEEQKKLALRMLLSIVEQYQPKSCFLWIDGVDYSGEYLMAEVMNTRSIGPNLVLCPDSDPGDGIFEVVLIGRNDKEKFAAYLADKLEGKDPVYNFKPIRARHVEISWAGRHVHVDDVALKIKKAIPVTINVRPGLVEFLV